MSFLKTVWGLLFRLFPCPTRVGLRRIGEPGRESPVLVTCNFDLTVKRLFKYLKGEDAWLLVGQSKGVNVWCAAGGDEFNTRSVVSVVKTSGIADLVDHRRLILPPFGAPGVRAVDVQKETGWSVRWGPAYGEDLPRYLEAGRKRDEGMKRAVYDWRERLDTALGSLFVFYLLGAGGFFLFYPSLLADYLVVAAAAFVFFMLFCPWLPGKNGLAKVLFIDAFLGAALIATEVLYEPNPFRADLVIAMSMILIYGTELGGLASTMKSDLDPFLARLGIGAVGNLDLAGSVRTELLNGYRELAYERAKCVGCRACGEVCPVAVWDFEEEERKAVQARLDRCTACRACLTQCPSGAIEALPAEPGKGKPENSG